MATFQASESQLNDRLDTRPSSALMPPRLDSKGHMQVYSQKHSHSHYKIFLWSEVLDNLICTLLYHKSYHQIVRQFTSSLHHHFAMLLLLAIRCWDKSSGPDMHCGLCVLGKQLIKGPVMMLTNWSLLIPVLKHQLYTLREIHFKVFVERWQYRLQFVSSVFVPLMAVLIGMLMTRWQQLWASYCNMAATWDALGHAGCRSTVNQHLDPPSAAWADPHRIVRSFDVSFSLLVRVTTSSLSPGMET